jgi:hypothetical protein
MWRTEARSADRPGALTAWRWRQAVIAGTNGGPERTRSGPRSRLGPPGAVFPL